MSLGLFTLLYDVVKFDIQCHCELAMIAMDSVYRWYDCYGLDSVAMWSLLPILNDTGTGQC